MQDLEIPKTWLRYSSCIKHSFSGKKFMGYEAQDFLATDLLAYNINILAYSHNKIYLEIKRLE